MAPGWLAGVVVTCVIVSGCTDSAEQPVTRVRATFAPAHALSTGELAQSAQVLRHRLAVAHVSGAQVSATTLGGVVVTVPDERRAVLHSLGARGILELRPLISQLVVTGGSCRPGVNPTGAADPPGTTIACSPDGTSAYLLGGLVLDSSGITGARAVRDAITRTWKVQMTCTATAAQSLAAAMQQLGGQRLALSLDGIVLASPVVAGVISGRIAEITAAYAAGEASVLVHAVSGGTLPVAFHVTSVAAATPAARTSGD
jgi:preprotein translocase subunit SecD